MAKWARKNNEGKIVEVIDFDPTGKFHESIVWESVPDSAEVDDLNGLTPETNLEAIAEQKRLDKELEDLLKSKESIEE